MVMVHPHGSFCFAELQTPNVDRAKRFYSKVLGWDVAAWPGPPAYNLFRLDQSRGAPITPCDVAGLRCGKGPPRWISYLSVENVDRTAARATQLGATLVNAPVDTLGLARTCVVADLEGAEFGLWEPRGHHGADVEDQPGSMWWVELMVRDVAAARQFYNTLFEWSTADTLKYGPPYTIFKVGHVSVGGALQFEPDWGVRPRWQIYFAVDDLEATVGQAERLGGVVEFSRRVPETGELCILRDPEKAVFAVMRPNDVA